MQHSVKNNLLIGFIVSVLLSLFVNFTMLMHTYKMQKEKGQINKRYFYGRNESRTMPRIAFIIPYFGFSYMPFCCLYWILKCISWATVCFVIKNIKQSCCLSV